MSAILGHHGNDVTGCPDPADRDVFFARVIFSLIERC